jgi:hypothetical protein
VFVRSGKMPIAGFGGLGLALLAFRFTASQDFSF